MNANGVVLDTNIVIELLKKNPATIETFMRLAQAKTRLLISPIVIAEVYAGAFEREHATVEALFDLCERVNLDPETGRQAGLYAKQFGKAFQGISLEDYLLAATAKVKRCALWTLNKKHYPMRDITLV